MLPSTFVGSPRSMQQNYQDTKTVVAKYGKPDLLLTYTCNPKAREITENLRGGQKSEYRPDLVSREFKLHLSELLKTDMFLVFQKRSLPHCHILIILRDSNDIDKIISAEDPELYV